VELAVTKEQLLAKSIEALAVRWNLRDAPKWVSLALHLWLTGKTTSEPDFPKAFQAWRAAREKAMAEGKRAEFPKWRSESWHLQMWLLGMVRRIIGGSSGVSEDEFNQLLAWLEDNCRRLEPVNEVRSVKLGKLQTSVWNVLLQMRGGPRQLEAGELAEAVRQLKPVPLPR
jgi:hypothetical protein